MKSKKTKIIGITLIVISVVSITACAGVMNHYWNVSESANDDSFCEDCPHITQEEVDAGWYWGFIDQKKPGTPDTWIHIGGDSLSAMWVDPDKVCETCPTISQEELDKGWYYSQSDQKKPGTPSNWLHGDEGTKSAMWYDPDETTWSWAQ